MINRDFEESRRGEVGDELVASVTCLASVNVCFLAVLGASRMWLMDFIVVEWRF